MSSPNGDCSAGFVPLTATREGKPFWLRLAGLPRQVVQRFRSSLRAKFIAVIVLLQMITMGIVTVVVERHQHDAILEQTRLRALALAHSLVALSESYLLSYNFIKLEQIAEKVPDDDPDVIYAVIHLHDGSIAAFSGRDDLQGTQLTDPVSLRAIHTTAPLVQKRLSVKTTAYGYDVAIPVFVPHSPRKWGTIRLGFSLQQAYERIAQTRRALCLLSLGAIACGTLLAVLLAMRVSRPIGQLVAGAQAFARGAYEQSVRVNTIDEFGYLARTFEQMMHEISHDMREQERLKAQLHQAQKMEAIGTMAGGIAHDFNNMLGAIIGFTELAFYELPPDSPVRKRLQEVRTAGTRAKDLVRQLLTFSRQHEQTRQPLYLHVIVQEVQRLLHASLPSTITFQQDLDKDAGMVLADPTQIHQVLLNLCTNAEYAMRDTSGILEVRVHNVEVDAALAAQYPALHLGPHVCLSVRDTGPGIPLEVVDRIFDPFFTTKPIGEGTGMGLAMVHGIVTGHDGVLTVESRLGVGTTFTLYLPQIHETAENATPTVTPSPHGVGRLLLIDDEAPLARMGQALLEHYGYEVISCTRSEEALATFHAEPHRFDLVITDQTMPHMTGERLSQELRRVRPDIPIILCTGFSHIMNAEKAKAMGIDAFLMKPLVARDWVSTIQQVLEHRTPQPRSARRTPE